MRRLVIQPRPNWQQRVEEYGLHFHTLDDEPYWDESACYQLTCHEVDTLEFATQTLHEMCLELVQYVLNERLFGLFMIPPEFETFVIESWEENQPSIYGRFDLAYNGSGPPKLLEYNADTPTALVEAAVGQWAWLKEVDEHGDQFNSIHERLIDAWKSLQGFDSQTIYFTTHSDSVEDWITTEYLRDTAIQAELSTEFIDIREIGYDSRRHVFLDRSEKVIHNIFKLYPWEWMIREEFGQFLPKSSTRWLEPPWKMILSCKSILPLLWQLFPESPYLLPASFHPMEMDCYVRKPIHSREGANIRVFKQGELLLETPGPYEEGPFVYQEIAPITPHQGRYPVIGSWVVSGVACGIGIREADTLITTNSSRFVPHQIKE